MKRTLTGIAALIAAAVLVAFAPGGQTSPGQIEVKHCGDFKYGLDGLRPGPSGITATNVSCWFARATALLGPAPGWHCHLVTGLLIACPHARQMVTFYGE